MDTDNCAEYSAKYEKIMGLLSEIKTLEQAGSKEAGTRSELLPKYRKITDKIKNLKSSLMDYEFVDLLPMVRRDRLADSYDSATELLQDAFDVNWMLLEPYDEGVWYAAFEKDLKIYLFNGYFASTIAAAVYPDRGPQKIGSGRPFGMA
jgi:hypothetical protein